jgi:hypothetical protein
MSNATPLTCGVLASEQYGLAGFPDDHEQSWCSSRGIRLMPRPAVIRQEASSE